MVISKLTLMGEKKEIIFLIFTPIQFLVQFVMTFWRQCNFWVIGLHFFVKTQ